MGALISLLIVGLLVFAGYYVYVTFIANDESFCEKRKGVELTTTGNLTKYAMDCNSPQCMQLLSNLQDSLADVADTSKMEDTEIVAGCAQLCNTYNEYISCACKNCPTCHPDCGLGSSAKCEKYLTCGPS